MKPRQTEATRIKRRLQKAGYKVTLLGPAQAAHQKKASRRRDRIAIESGRATAQEIQAKNSLFGSSFPKFRIVDYGGLDE